MNTSKLELQIIRSIFQKKGYKFFESGKFNLNIFGIRSSERKVGAFDDFIAVVYKDGNDDFVVKWWPATTDTGSFYAQNPLNPHGCAFLVPGQHSKAFKIGLHHGKYEALVQLSPLPVYRDNDKDLVMDLDPSKIETGMFGLNLHSVDPKMESFQNYKWSAGCQVMPKKKNHLELMALCKKSAAIYGNSFTYTLFNESDFA